APCATAPLRVGRNHTRVHHVWHGGVPAERDSSALDSFRLVLGMTNAVSSPRETYGPRCSLAHCSRTEDPLCPCRRRGAAGAASTTTTRMPMRSQSAACEQAKGQPCT